MNPIDLRSAHRQHGHRTQLPSQNAEEKVTSLTRRSATLLTRFYRSNSHKEDYGTSEQSDTLSFSTRQTSGFGQLRQRSPMSKAWNGSTPIWMSAGPPRAIDREHHRSQPAPCEFGWLLRVELALDLSCISRVLNSASLNLLPRSSS